MDYFFGTVACIANITFTTMQLPLIYVSVLYAELAYGCPVSNTACYVDKIYV